MNKHVVTLAFIVAACVSVLSDHGVFGSFCLAAACIMEMF